MIINASTNRERYNEDPLKQVHSSLTFRILSRIKIVLGAKVEFRKLVLGL
jgi:hypothetical protein